MFFAVILFAESDSSNYDNISMTAVRAPLQDTGFLSGIIQVWDVTSMMPA